LRQLNGIGNDFAVGLVAEGDGDVDRPDGLVPLSFARSVPTYPLTQKSIESDAIIDSPLIR